jgi:hypothetical protein
MCVVCDRAATTRHRAAHPGYDTQWRYGVSYDDMLTAQDGHCAICPTTPEQNGKALAVDHDHECCPGRRSCGKCVRGLLCDRCNRQLPSVYMLCAMLEYLSHE